MPDSVVPYSREALFSPGPPRTYTGRQLDEIAFPLGGIGTGTVSLGGWGQLRDFEIFNRPEKGLQFLYTFFTLHARWGDAQPVTRVLQGPVGGTCTGHGSGVDRAGGAGLPHFRGCAFTGGFPIANVSLDDDAMPVRVSIEAFNPFIPLNDKDSSIPVAILLFTLESKLSEPVQISLLANLENRVGHPDVGGGTIAFRDGSSVCGLSMGTSKHAPESPRYGSLALATPWRDVNVATHWYRGGWFDSLHWFWDHVSQSGELPENREPAQASDGATDVGSIGLRAVVPAGGAIRLPIIMAWHIPNFEKYWGEHAVWPNYYAALFRDAWDVAEYVGRELSRLEGETKAFRDALYASSLPEPVLDAVSSQLSVLKSTTCLRLTDGTFYGFEGCHPSSGCCEGTCTHVWNYAQALPFLFPALERSVREADYRHNQAPDGHMTFRMPLPLGVHPEPTFHAAADGQMGGVVKTYREWLVSGDDEWLRRLWPSVRKALEYAWLQWDKDRDGVMEGVQHNTYDVEFHGPNTMTGSIYLAALRAGEEMARRLGDEEAAAAYHEVYQRGRAWTDANLFNGEYYRQEVRPAPMVADPDPLTGWPKYQYGDGCLSDQLLGQLMAQITDLGHVLDPDHVRAALRSVFVHNWRPSLATHANPQRIYALNDEAGLLVCSWPRGGRPAYPVPYCDEVWTGIEYQVASHLIYEGLLEEGLAIVKGARNRHDGTRRNPWNEFECGNHYARALASYGLLLALSGFSIRAADGWLGFAPRMAEADFRCFFSTNTGWGIFHQRRRDGETQAALSVRWGSVTLSQLGLRAAGGSATAAIGGVPVAAEWNGSAVVLAQSVAISAGEELTVTVR